METSRLCLETALKLETAAMWAWPPKETRRVDGWLLRAADGHTRRANSVQALVFAADTDLSRAMDQVEAWYGARGLAACYQVTDYAAPARLDEALAARHYTRLPSVSILTGNLAALAPPNGVRIELNSRPTPRAMNALCDPHWPPDRRRAQAELFGRIRRPHSFGIVIDGQQPVAGALVVVDRDVAGIFSLRTAVPARGRGYARAVVQRLGSWARGMGAKQLYLQVEDDNAPALASLAPLGLKRQYGYWYRELPAQAA